MPTASNAKKTEISQAELELKRRGRRRLIGAVTLGLLAVVILPMIFDSQPKKATTDATPKQEITIQIPPKEGLSPLPAPVVPPSAPAAPVVPVIPVAPPVSVPTPAAPPASAPPPVAKVVDVPKVEALKPATPAAKPEPVKPPPTPAPQKAEPTKAGNFVVQIGAYKDADNAKALVAQLKEAKLPVFTDTVAVKTGNVTRVRLGPFANREKADNALVQAKLIGVTGKVVPAQ